MGEETGARVDLEKVPLKYSGLNYTEIWISEAQERMVIAVPPENIDESIEAFARVKTCKPRSSANLPMTSACNL